MHCSVSGLESTLSRRAHNRPPACLPRRPVPGSRPLLALHCHPLAFVPFLVARWVTTPKYDASNRQHVAIVDEIIIGNGLPVSEPGGGPDLLARARRRGARSGAARKRRAGARLPSLDSSKRAARRPRPQTIAPWPPPLPLPPPSAPTAGRRRRRRASLWASSCWTAATWRRHPRPRCSPGARADDRHELGAPLRTSLLRCWALLPPPVC